MPRQLVDILFPEARKRVLALLLLDPENRLHVREIARVTGTSPGTLARELTRLNEAGLLTRERTGNQLHYGANTASPIYPELASILRKTAGWPRALREALAPLAERLQLAFVFGSMAAGTAGPDSDIDLLLVGDGIGFAEVVTLLHPLEASLGREISPKLYSAGEWQRLAHANGGFYRDVMAKPRLFLIGGDDEPR